MHRGEQVAHLRAVWPLPLLNAHSTTLLCTVQLIIIDVTLRKDLRTESQNRIADITTQAQVPWFGILQRWTSEPDIFSHQSKRQIQTHIFKESNTKNTYKHNHSTFVIQIQVATVQTENINADPILHQPREAPICHTRLPVLSSRVFLFVEWV